MAIKEKPQTPTEIELTIRLESISQLLERITDTMEGTIRSRGIKEKIVEMQLNIEANKQAYLEMQTVISKVEERIGKTISIAMSHVEETINNKFETFKIETEKLQKEAESQKTILDKISPFANIFAWIVTAGGGILLTMLLTGKIHVALVP